LNTSSREVISAIPGMEDIAPAIVDWRDEDDMPLPGGVEDLYYISLDPPYHCKNSSLETMEELLAIKGITPQLIQDIKPLTTVYGHARLNINTVSGEVLEVVLSSLVPPGPASLIDTIMLYRQGLDGEEGTMDDNIFESTGTVKDSLLPYGLTPEEENSIDSMVANNLIDVKSSCYRVSLKAVYEGRYNFNIESLLFETEGDKIEIIYWQEK